MWNNTDGVDSILLKQEKFLDLGLYSIIHLDNIITPKNRHNKFHVSQYIWRFVVLLIYFCFLWHGRDTFSQ